jgi:hypothetical protein
MSNLSNALKTKYPEDIGRIKASIPFLVRFTDKEIEYIYESFSDSYAAQWLTISEESMRDFIEWLEN